MLCDLDAGEGETITMQRRLLLSGHVLDSGRPLGEVMVSLIRHSGEYVGTTTADATGAYEIGLPPAGRYVLTVVDHATGTIRAASATFVGWAGFPLADALVSRLSVPVSVENDVNAWS